MAGSEAILHLDLAALGLAVEIVVVAIGDVVAGLVHDGTGDFGLEKRREEYARLYVRTVWYAR